VTASVRPKLAVWKFASCDGCQLSLLDCEDELLQVAGAVTIAHFAEATSARIRGPYDVSLVEGSITTADGAERIARIRASSKCLVTIGACATAGGIQALRNFGHVEEFLGVAYTQPSFIATLAEVTPIAAHVPVDHEIRGCPITKAQLLEVLSALLIGRRPALPSSSVCEECKRKGNPCVLVSRGAPCLGPVTHAGCGALCPTYQRGCYGCFGPSDTPNVESMVATLRTLGEDDPSIVRLLRTFNATAPAFRDGSVRIELDATRRRHGGS
jgi:coenzyme F420-reducing hydrogenase gamma subunit